MSELIRVKFDGGLAGTGQLHFYEYSRSQYAMARFIATIEHFRRTGKVAERITVSSNVDIIVRSPQRGSFVEDLLIPAIQQGMATVLSTPLSSLISYVWHLLAPRSETTDQAVEQFAKIRIAEVQASVAIEEQRTQQLAIWQKIVDGERAKASDALELARWALNTTNVAVGRLGHSQQELAEMRDELEAEVQREKEFSDHMDALEGVEESTMNRLTSRLRPMVPEMALPLRRSADRMSMSHGEPDTTYANITPSVVAAIQDRDAEEIVVELIGHVKSYDRDSGVGKVTSEELLRVLNFVVPLRDRARLRDRILEAMKRERVLLLCRRIVDRSGLPTSLILIDLDLDPNGTVALTSK
ncbi:hypothetical protein MPLDJ20_60097 [Mesorhizobium plurifarium]|uniref:DUF7946 domain-containing protein n=1 Tax=Mesorhizobium plurifarium TaxID=69974 RepID=A0A090FMW9_MESPL|nr:hypothetical protein MPLDJ20_60097 [Mesorhizobium plurifarium]